jgi:transcriptional regulator with PAS, ATPase and Fis domain
MPATFAQREFQTTAGSGENIQNPADNVTLRSETDRRQQIDRRRNPLDRPSEVEQPSGIAALKKLVSKSPKMHEVFQCVKKAAPVDSTVLVTGESGTGKELIAKAIHAASVRSEGPMVTINMAAVPETLIESELLGHTKGAFTGANQDRIGRFEAAHRGTIFIDEIGDLPLSSQAKLLRVLENRVVSPVGGNEERKVDVRVVAATNRPLEDLVASEDFRPDLYYRLNIIRISLPPLRERVGDIPLLVDHFVDHFCATYRRGTLRVDGKLMAYLDSLYWPGNVRELRNCVESMVVLARSDTLTIDDVPPVVRENSESRQSCFDVPDDLSLAEIEEAVIKDVLDRCHGNRTGAAHKLGISVRTLQRRLASS